MIRFAALLAFLTLPATAAAAQAPFEGSIGMNVTDDDGKTTPVTYLQKGGKIRFDFSADGQKGGIVIDGAAQKMLVIMDEMKMYMEMPMMGPTPGMGRQSGRGTTGRGATGRAAVRTGRTETIAGYQCEHVTTIDDDGASVDSCVTSELGSFRMFGSGNPMQPPQEEAWTSGLGGSFPLKATKGDKVLMEVTKVQRTTLDAALFAAPAGYRKFAMPGRGGPGA